MEKWHALQIKEVFAKLKSSREGLSSAAAKHRLLEHGKNTITVEKKISVIKIFIAQFTNLLVLILLAAALVSFFIGMFPGHEESLWDALLIVAILLANGIFGFVQEYKAEKTLEALKKLASPTATVIRNGKEKVIPSHNIVPGDVLVVHEGDKVAADARIIETLSLGVDESMLTGESVPVTKWPGKLKTSIALADRTNMLYMNTNVTRGKALALAVETGLHTEVGKIAQEIATAEEKESMFKKEIAEMGKKIAYLVLGVIFIVLITQILIAQEDPVIIFLTAISLAVAAIPEGLPAVVTIALALGAQRMLKGNALMRKLDTIENFSSIDIICTDKTGTMTENVMTATEIYWQDKTIKVSGKGWEQKGAFFHNNQLYNPRNIQRLLECAVLCNDAELKDGKFKGDPTEIAILVPAYKANLKVDTLRKNHRRIGEISFSSERKMMTTLHSYAKGKIAFTKGAAERVLASCNRYYHQGKVKRLTPAVRKQIMSKHDDMARRALRVLAFAYTENMSIAQENEEKNLIFLGLIGMMDPPREGVKEAITECRAAGIRVVMLTGDNQLTAQSIGKELGFRPTTMRGPTLDLLNDEQLKKTVARIDIFARTTPKHKVRILQALKETGHVVAMTGDGVNDAPSLQNSDVGIAMGVRGTEVSREASDMILLDDNFVSIRNAIEQGRGIFDNIRKFFVYLLGANTAEVLVVFIASIFGWGLPLLAAHLLWINLLTDGLPAVALGVDPPAKDVMQRKPRKKKGMIGRKEMHFMLALGLSATIPILWLFGQHRFDLVKAQTLVFTAFVIIELLKVFLVRQRFHNSLFGNHWLFIAVAISFILQLTVLYIPALSEFFGVVPLALEDWIVIAIAAFCSIIIYSVLRTFEKLLIRKKLISLGR